MIDDRQPHDRGQADGGLHVVGEDQEGAAERPDPAVRRDPVETRGHSVLPHAPVELPPRRRRPERPTLLEGGAGAAAQIGRAADQVGDRGGDRLEREARGLPGGELATRGRDHRQRLVPRLGQSPCHPPPELGRMLRILARVGVPALPPIRLLRRAPLQRGSPVRQGILGDVKRGLRGPAEDLLGPPDLLRAKRGAVRLRGVPLGRRRIGDDGAEDHQCRTHGLRRGPAPAPPRSRRDRCRPRPGRRAIRRPRNGVAPPR